MMRSNKIIAIGDIHGEYSKLMNLFEKLDISKNDTIVFLGDYIDRGQDSKKVIDFIISLKDQYNVITLKGNHEQFAIETKESIFKGIGNTKIMDSWFLNGGLATLLSYDQESTKLKYYNKVIYDMFELHADFFNNLRLTYETDTHIFVHGYLSSELDVQDQEEMFCLWGRYHDIFPHKSEKVVVCGHTIHNEVKNDGYKICIDTGSFKKDGYITAMIIDDKDIKYVNSK
jgi:serine/threonine protein phosphatase 1